MNRGSLKARKQEVVRNAIFDAGVEIFARKGFDETTVEEVAHAAGISRRSFFRYFASKDDLLAQNVAHFGAALNQAISACPPAFAPLEVIRQTVLSVGRASVSHPLTRRVIEISQRSASARQAHLSRWIDVEDSVAQAFAGRIKNATGDDLKPRLMASLTLSVMNVAIIAWFRGEFPDFDEAVKHALSNLTRIANSQADPTKPRADVLREPDSPHSGGRRRSRSARS